VDVKEEIRRLAWKAGASLVGIANLDSTAAIVLGFPAETKVSELILCTKKLAEALERLGLAAQLVHPFDTSLSLRALALRAGLGFKGRNGLVVSRELGPRVVFTAILIDAKLEQPFEPSGLSNFCSSCKACVDACPTGALSTGEMSKCRAHNGREDDGRCRTCMDICPKAVPAC